MALFKYFLQLCLLAFAVAAAAPTAATAATTTVAVAASFADVARALAAAFADQGRHQAVIVVGSSGKLASQILNGAPFDIFLSADEERPADLVTRGMALAEDRFTYATGRLALWSADRRRLSGDGTAWLKQAGTGRIAVANPKLAPYGVAALQTLAALGLQEAMTPRLVFGENVGQAFALARSGAAEAAFVAWSQALTPEGKTGSSWLVPQTLHQPLRQDGVLLARAKANLAARDFVSFLASTRAISMIREAGFGG